VCGLGKSFPAGRRAALRKELKNGIVIVRGLPDTRDYAIFQQDKVFWYLTGVESPGATLMMDLDGDHDILFLPPRNANREGWEGELWDAKDEWVKDYWLRRARHERPGQCPQDLISPRRVWISKEPWIAPPAAPIAPSRMTSVQAIRSDGRKSRGEARGGSSKYKCEVKAVDPCSTVRRVKTRRRSAVTRGSLGAMAISKRCARRRPASANGRSV
jgi:Xaa-Pro aminopeptidase